MNVLFISYDGMTDPLGQSQVIPYLKGLTAFGYRFTILSCDKPSLFNQNKERVIDQLAGFPIRWVSIPYHKNPPVLSSVFDYYALKKRARRLHTQEPFDMVHTRPGVPTLVALWLKKKYGIRFLNDVRGFWADERVDGGMWNLRNPLYKQVYSFFKKHELECLEKADATTCLTFAAKEEINKWNIKMRTGLTVIPCSADLDLFSRDHIDPVARDVMKNNLYIKKGDLVISYLGSIGGWYLTGDMMRFCSRLSKEVPSAKFLFISPHRHPEIIKAAKQYDLDRDKLILKGASRNEVPILLSLSDYSIFFIKPCYSKLSSSPTKHGEIMGMGIPVITNSGVGDVEMIVKKYNAGFIVSDFSDAAFDSVITKIKERSFDPVQIRKGAEEFYSLEEAINSYKKVYQQVLN